MDAALYGTYTDAVSFYIEKITFDGVDVTATPLDLAGQLAHAERSPEEVEEISNTVLDGLEKVRDGKLLARSEKRSLLDALESYKAALSARPGNERGLDDLSKVYAHLLGLPALASLDADAPSVPVSVDADRGIEI